MTSEDLSKLLHSLPERISDAIRPWAENTPDQLCLVESNGTWTYKQLAAAVGEARAWLGESGVRSGDRVMLVCENCRSFVACLLALSSLDAWPVLVNARLSAREVDEIREHCAARRVLYTVAVSPHAREHARRDGALIAEIGTLGPIGIGALSEAVSTEPLDPNPSQRVASLIYTSGTTGRPKGVMLTHQNLLFLAAGSARIRRLTPDDRMYGVLPMSHAVGLSVVLLGTLLSGGTVYLSQRFDPAAACRSIERDHVTVFLGVPGMFALLVEYAKMKEIRALHFPALRIVSSSGAPLQPVIKRDVESLFGLALHNGYGVTECSPTIAQADIDEPCRDLSVGRVFPGLEIKLVGTDGEAANEGEPGELWVRGPNVMKGYYRSPVDTQSVINGDGWFNTRDLARMENGHLFIVGRTKELIIRFGFNVYPAEVEAVLGAHPAVARCAVIGRASETMGEDIVAFIQPKPHWVVTIEELSRYASQRLAPYKLPTDIVLMDRMPTTPTGKISKGELARMQAARF
ncbi:MAG: class I adenylate-forming enzyme family protein [Candidatus Acidiferrales bacterium]